MPTIALLNQSGEKINDLELSATVFGIEELNQQVIYDVVNCQRAAMRQGTHDVKNRSEVRGGGKKPWRQKGTGRARAGTLRSPIFRHGATVFGPTGTQNYKLKMNKNVAFIAIASALSDKVASNNLVAITDEKFASCKTKDFVKALASMKLEGKILLVLTEYDENLVKAAGNLPNIIIVSVDNVSVYDVLNANKVVMTQAAIKAYDIEDVEEEVK